MRTDGGVTAPAGQVLPRVRFVPSFLDRDLSVGDEWSAVGLWVGDPSRDGSPFVVPINVAYRYRGSDVYAGEPIHVFDGGYRLRYPVAIAEDLLPLVEATGFPTLSPTVSSAEGSHRLTIFVSEDGRRVLLIRDVLSDSFVLADGTRLQEDGFSLTFWRTSVPIEDVAALAEEVGPAASVERVDDGVRLTIGDLRFRADSAELLPGEGPRLKTIADALSRYPDRTILVVGHTAEVGRPEGQARLSVARARAVVEALIAAGIRASRLIYEGRGGTEPVADNATETGRARNRRVEITVLDDRF